VKLYDSCAVGRPLVVAAPGEPHRVAEGAGIAVTAPPGNARALADAVRRLAGDETLRASLAEAGRRFALEHTRERQTAELEAVLRAVAA
jgi:colanic acid biosynthesis glycosyl transferase WcaI